MPELSSKHACEATFIKPARRLLSIETRTCVRSQAEAGRSLPPVPLHATPGAHPGTFQAMSVADITVQFDDSRAKRNALILATGQALYGSATVIMFTTAGLIGVEIAPSKAWATLPISAFVIGTALSTIPAAMLMKRIGGGRASCWARWRARSGR
jgi:hypothetical protein